MLNFEEELAKFKPSRDIDQVEDTIVNRDITDVTDIMVQFLKEQLEQDSREQGCVWNVYIAITRWEAEDTASSAAVM